MIFSPSAIASLAEMAIKEHIKDMQKDMPDFQVEPTSITMTIQADPQVPGGIAISASGYPLKEVKAASDLEKRKAEWWRSGDTGISSETIIALFSGTERDRPDTPSDPSDFGRCHRLLKRIPEFRLRLGEVAAKYPKWKPLVDNWDELTALYKEELDNGKGSAPKLYKRMQELLGR